MEEMFIVGRTTPQEVYVASFDREFALDEYLIISDSEHDNPVGEVIETFSYEKIDSTTFDPSTGIYTSLSNFIGSEIKVVYIAKLKILEEKDVPVKVGTSVYEPRYEDVENLLINASPEKGFTLGIIKGTEKLKNKIPQQIQNISPLFNPKERKTISQTGIPFIIDHYSFQNYPHLAFLGGSGSGKSFAIRVFCEEIMKKSIPGVVLDPHYELTFDDIIPDIPKETKYNFKNKYEVFKVGVNVGIKFTEITTDELISLMEFVADVSQPMRGAIEELHQKSDSFSTLYTRIENLRIAFENMEKPEHERDDLPADVVLLYERHKSKIAGLATLQAVSWRLNQLDKTGIFSSDITKVELCLLKRKLAVIRGDMRLLKMLSSYLFRKVYRKRRHYKDWEQSNMVSGDIKNKPSKFPPFFIIMDEAHHFAPNGINSNPTKAVFREISQEARKYGINLVMGTQRPALLDTTIMAQLNTKFIFRTSIVDDMEMIRKETNLNNKQVTRLPNLTSGNAFVSSATLSRTLYIKFRTTITKSPHQEHPFDELDDFDTSSGLKNILKEFLPLSLETLPQCHSKINNKAGRNVGIEEITEVLEEMAEQGEIDVERSAFGNRYILI